MKEEFKEEDEWEKITGQLQPPRANRFIPRNVTSKVIGRKLIGDVLKNDNPKKIPFRED